MQHNNNTNKDLKGNPYLLYRLRTFILSRDKFEEVTKSKN